MFKLRPHPMCYVDNFKYFALVFDVLMNFCAELDNYVFIELKISISALRAFFPEQGMSLIRHAPR